MSISIREAVPGDAENLVAQSSLCPMQCSSASSASWVRPFLASATRRLLRLVFGALTEAKGSARNCCWRQFAGHPRRAFHASSCTLR